METNPKKQRQHFYRDYTSGQWSMSELCDRYQISRPTGYKWVDRIEADGLRAVEDRSRPSTLRPRWRIFRGVLWYRRSFQRVTENSMHDHPGPHAV